MKCELYNDNLNTELKQVKPISEVCEMSKYKNMEYQRHN